MLHSSFYRMGALSVLFMVTHCLRLLKVHYITSSFGPFVPAFQFLFPLSGLYGGFLASSFFIIAQKIVTYTLYGGSFFTLERLYIPTLCSSLYLSCDNKIFRYAIPLLCIALFIAHPVGKEAWFYAMYWIIPVLMAFFARDTIFGIMLGSTFTAHAVGSVLWLYLAPLTPEAYWALMPIVLVERTLFASGMYCVHIGIMFFVRSVASWIDIRHYSTQVR